VNLSISKSGRYSVLKRFRGEETEFTLSSIHNIAVTVRDFYGV
jgi:hypothetical protein